MNWNVQRYWILGLLVFGLLQACGSKDEIRGQEAAGVGGTGQPVRTPQPNEPRDPSREGPNSQLQIACESRGDSGSASWLRFPSSTMASGDRFMPEWEAPWKVPTIVSTGGGALRFLAYGGGRAVEARYDFTEKRGETSGTTFSLPSPVRSALYQTQRISGGRTIAISPNRRWMAVSSGSDVAVRSLANNVVIQRWEGTGSLSQIRWEPRADGSSEVFADRIGGGAFRQLYLWISADGKVLRRQEINPASGYSALGLQRWDGDTLVWHEWRASGSVIAFSKAGAAPVRYSIDGRFGPGMAVLRAEGELSLGFVSRAGLSFFTLSENGPRLARSEEFPPRVREAIDENRFGWQPGAFYSQVNGTQLFTHLPATFGVMLFAIDGGRQFRQLGQYECDNPDFYLEAL